MLNVPWKIQILPTIQQQFISILKLAEHFRFMRKEIDKHYSQHTTITTHHYIPELYKLFSAPFGPVIIHGV